MKKLLLLGMLWAQGIYAATLETIRERDFLTVGVRNQFKGFGYLNSQDRYEGLEIEMARQIAKRILGDDQKIKFVPVSGAKRITALKTDEVDFVLAYFVINDHRKKAIDFGEPYMHAYLGAINHDHQSMTHPQYFADKKVLVLDSGSADIYFRHHLPEVQLTKCDQYERCFQIFAAKEVDVFVNDLNALHLMSQLHRGHQDHIHNLSHLGYRENIAPAVDKGNQDLLDIINDEIRAMKHDGRLEEIFKRVTQPHMRDVQASELLVL